MTGASTLLIDADLRHPNVHVLLDEKVTQGLFEFLAADQETAIDQVTLVKEGETGLNVLLGSKPSSVATDALLMSPRFDEVMNFAKAQYDVVVVDTPPIGLVVDASIVARHCELGIFVVRHASTGQQDVRAGLRDLGMRTDLPICGLLNNVSEVDGPFRGYKRKYRNYYQ